MENKKVLRILFISIIVFLSLFFGSGIYFLVSGALGAGLIGIGIALLGAALCLYLGNNILFFIKEPDVQTQIAIQSEDLGFTMSVNVTYDGENKDLSVSDQRGSVCLLDDCFLLKGIGDAPVRLAYVDAEIDYSEQNVLLNGSFYHGDVKDAGSCVILCGSLIKLKGLKQMIQLKVKGVTAHE